MDQWINSAGELQTGDCPGFGWTLASGDQIAAQLPTQQWADYQMVVQAMLNKTDTSFTRIQEAILLGKTTGSMPDVIAFLQFRADLRAIRAQAAIVPAVIPTSFPVQPPYPANT